MATLKIDDWPQIWLILIYLIEALVLHLHGGDTLSHAADTPCATVVGRPALKIRSHHIYRLQTFPVERSDTTRWIEGELCDEVFVSTITYTGVESWFQLTVSCPARPRPFHYLSKIYNRKSSSTWWVSLYLLITQDKIKREAAKRRGTVNL